jgi:hypothetical protein
MVEQFSRVARVFASDEINLAQESDRPVRDVLEISDGG